MFADSVITLENVQSTSGTTSSSNQITLSNFNVGSGTNRLLLVGISANNNNPASVTFNGTPLTQAVGSFFNNDAEFWYLTNPSGTGRIVVTMSGPTQAAVGAYSFAGVNQTSPIATTAKIFNTAPSSPSITITIQYPNDWMLDLPSIWGGVTLGSPTCTQHWDLNVPNAITGASSSTIVPSPGTVTCGWTASTDDQWDDVAVEMRSVAASSTTVPSVSQNPLVTGGGSTNSTSSGSSSAVIPSISLVPSSASASTASATFKDPLPGSSGSKGDAIDDSPSPSTLYPSFGFVPYRTFHDGLTINGQIHDLSSYSIAIPKYTMDVGKTVTIKIKQEPVYYSNNWKDLSIYMNFGGKDTAIYNANMKLEDSRETGAYIYDPQRYVSNFTANTTMDNEFAYTVFQFTAVKEMPDTSMIISAIDNYTRVTNVLVNGAIQFGQDPAVVPVQQPRWLHLYNNVTYADMAVEEAGYVKPQIFAHITDSDQVWKGSDGGSVQWSFDSANGTASIALFDKNHAQVYQKTEALRKDLGKIRTMYSWDALNQLSRTDTAKLESMKNAEEQKAQTHLQNLEHGNFAHYMGYALHS